MESCSACSKGIKSKNWRVVRDVDLFKVLLELAPNEVQLLGKRICKPCYSSVEKIQKNKQKIEDLMEQSDILKRSISQKLRELYGSKESEAEGQRQSESIPSVKTRGCRKRTKACRALHFSRSSEQSPGVFVSHKIGRGSRFRVSYL